jgi:hypothetical protein
MPKFSAFTPFGHLRFSSRPPTGQVLYEEEVRLYGGETNISTSFDDSPINAEIYSESMQRARAKDNATLAGQQFIPLRAVPMLPKLESEFGLVPGPKESIRARQKAVSAAAKISRGARLENVYSVLRELLGDDLIAIVPTVKGLHTETSDSPELVGLWKIPGTQKGVYRLTRAISTVGVPITVPIEYVAGEPGGFPTGPQVIVDVGDANRTECVYVNNGTATSFQATFTKPHNKGTLVASGRVPNLGSTKRHTNFVLSIAAMADPEKRRIANRALAKLMRGISTWSLVQENEGGGAGPFVIGESPIGRAATQALSY